MSSTPNSAAGPGASHTIRIAYSAHTDAGTYLLDREGICRGFVPSPDQSGSFRVRAEAANRCIGAQYVAAIDVTEPGALVQLPRVGAALLLGVVDENGRISLLRTGPIVRYETLGDARAHVSEPSEIKLDVDWDDESTASGIGPSKSMVVPSGMQTRRAAETIDAETHPPDRPSEPTAVCFRAGELLRTARPISSSVPPAPATPIVPVVDVPPAALSSDPFSDALTPATRSPRSTRATHQSSTVGSGSRLVDADEPTLAGEISTESSGRRT